MNPDIIFVHAPKTGGSSIKYHLARHAPERWLNPPHNFHPRGPDAEGIDQSRMRNVVRSKNFWVLRVDFIFNGMHRHPRNAIRRDPGAFCFGTVRNPYEKIQSAAFEWGGRGEYDYGDIIEELIYQMPIDEEFLTLVPRGNIMRFENLAGDFAQIAEQIAVPPDLPMVNHFPGRVLPELTAAQKAAIYYRHRWTFDTFGYDR